MIGCGGKVGGAHSDAGQGAVGAPEQQVGVVAALDVEEFKPQSPEWVEGMGDGDELRRLL